MDKSKFSNHAAIKEVKITDRFWTEKLELIKNVVIPYQYLALQDKIDGAEKSYCIENFIKAGKTAKALKEGKSVPVYPVDKWCYNDDNCESGAFHGWVFQDSDVYKWLEAVGYILARDDDEELKKKADEFIDTICEAQLESGYLDTLYIINDRDKCFTNLKDYHELYCFGHLAEAAVAYYNSTGERKLLEATCRFADLICSTFGENGIKGYPGHEICEMALVKLYDVTGKKDYLDTAKFFIDERGKNPYYFDSERGESTDGTPYIYNQAHIEPRNQTEAVGHAVRGVYLYSGMADIAKRYSDDGLYSACKSIWRDIADTKLYITGGIGSTVDGEAFTFPYDLPNDLAYCETCASVGLIFFARRMGEIEEKAEYQSVIERALYNTVLSGMAEDGKSFFYVNPLEVLPEASHKDSRKRHIKPVRQKWFSCACCPPNLARLIASLGEYIYTENDSEIYINQFIGSTLTSDKADIEISGDYLSSGEIIINVKHKRDFTLKVRNGEHGYTPYIINKDTTIELKQDRKVRLVKCSNKVRENVGKVAVMKGNTVYCLEQIDNGWDLHRLLISSEPQFEERNGYILAQGYREKEDAGLYYEYTEPDYERTILKFIPYYKWANRGENEMTVYLRVKNEV